MPRKLFGIEEVEGDAFGRKGGRERLVAVGGEQDGVAVLNAGADRERINNSAIPAIKRRGEADRQRPCRAGDNGNGAGLRTQDRVADFGSEDLGLRRVERDGPGKPAGDGEGFGIAQFRLRARRGSWRGDGRRLLSGRRGGAGSETQDARACQDGGKAHQCALVISAMSASVTVPQETRTPEYSMPVAGAV